MVYIHVGFPKTGTTTLQSIFPQIAEIISLGKRNRFEYLDQSYEDFFSHVVGDIPNDPYALNKAKHLFDNSFGKLETDKKVVISDEGFTVPNDRDFIELANRAHQFFPIAKVLLVIRNQTSLITSYYQMSPSDPRRSNDNHKIISFDEWLDIMLNHRMEQFISKWKFSETISQYVDLYGKDNVTVLPYEKLLNEAPNYYQDIDRWIGLKPGTIELRSKEIENQNTSSEVRVHNLYRHFFGQSDINKYIPQFAKDFVYNYFKKNKKKVEMSPKFANQLNAYYAASNSELEKTFELELKALGYPLL